MGDIPVEELLDILSEVPLTAGIPRDELEYIITGLPYKDMTLDELLDILEDLIPLSGAPATGDNSLRWEILAMLSGTGLICMYLSGKKRKEEN